MAEAFAEGAASFACAQQPASCERGPPRCLLLSDVLLGWMGQPGRADHVGGDDVLERAGGSQSELYGLSLA